MMLRVLLAVLLCAGAVRAEKGEDREREEREHEAREEREREEARHREHGEARPGDDELLYAMGAILGARVSGYGLSPKELARVQRGFADAAAGRKLKLKETDLEEWGPRVDAMLQRRGNPALTREKDKGKKLAEAEAKEEGAETLESGVVLRSLRPGDGESPKPTDRVRVKYEGRTADGKVFDSSEGADVPLDRVVKCWTAAVPKMKVGGKARLVCPSSMAYGDQGRPPQVKGGGAVVFDIELLAIAR
jgi:FKBP-type peptidyl-prolyl cis-trans isomerase FkpA